MPKTTPTSKSKKAAAKEFRAIAKTIVDRIAKDPDFREAVLVDPAGALERAGFEEQLAQIAWPATGAAVDCTTTCGYRSCTRTCITTCYRSCRLAVL